MEHLLDLLGYLLSGGFFKVIAGSLKLRDGLELRWTWFSQSAWREAQCLLHLHIFSDFFEIFSALRVVAGCVPFPSPCLGQGWPRGPPTTQLATKSCNEAVQSHLFRWRFGRFGRPLAWRQWALWTPQLRIAQQFEHMFTIFYLCSWHWFCVSSEGCILAVPRFAPYFDPL